MNTLTSVSVMTPGWMTQWEAPCTVALSDAINTTSVNSSTLITGAINTTSVNSAALIAAATVVGAGVLGYAVAYAVNPISQGNSAKEADRLANQFNESTLAGKVCKVCEKAPIVGGLPRAVLALINIIKNVALTGIHKAASLIRKDNAKFVAVRWKMAEYDALNIKKGLGQLIPSYFKKQA